MPSLSKSCRACKSRLPRGAKYCPECGAVASASGPQPDAEHDVEKFFNLAVDMLCIAGVDGYFKHVNPAFERTLGYTPAEMMEKPFVDFIHPEDRTETLREVDKLATGIPTLSFRNRYRCKDGSYKHLHWTSFPDPESGMLYAVARDVTEVHNMENELLRLRSELRKREQGSEGAS